MLLLSLASTHLIGAAHAADPVERYPYIQRVTPTEATLCWMTADPIEGRVLIGEIADDLPRSLGSPQDRFHEVRVDGLTPGSTWYYVVEAELDGEWRRISEPQAFTTAPTPGDHGGFRAWVLGDSGTLSEAQFEVARTWRRFVAGDEADLWLHTGDIAYNSAYEYELTETVFDVYPDLLAVTPIFPTYGNHDGYGSDSDTQYGPWFDAFALPAEGEGGGVPSKREDFYAYEWGNAHFISLNAFDADRSEGGEMAQWLKADLDAVDPTVIDWIIAYFHHPSYSKGSHDSDYEIELVEMRENIGPILEAGGVDLVLNGHSHTYERSYLLDGAYHTPSDSLGILDRQRGDPLWGEAYRKAPGLAGHGGTVYTVAGHGGASVSIRDQHPLMAYAEAVNGSVALDIEGTGLKLTNVRADGLLADRAAILKGRGLMLISPDGGELMVPGEPRTVRWVSSGDFAQVRLSYSVDGQSWTAITELKDTGGYTWTPPDLGGQRAWLRVEDAADSSVSDRSSGRFVLGGDLTSLAGPETSWRYHQGDDPGYEWIYPTYDDSGWAEGVGPFGYGGDSSDSSDSSTALNEGQASYYLRRTVHLDREVEAARLRVRVDDGVIVWLNQQEILRWNVDSTSHDSYAAIQSAEVEGGEVLLQVLNPGLFEPGDNTIAVMVKPHSDDRDSLTMDLALRARLGEEFSAADALENDGGGEDQRDGFDPEGHGDSEPPPPDTDEPDDDTDPVTEEGLPLLHPESRCSCAAPLTPSALLLIPGLAILLRRRRE